MPDEETATPTVSAPATPGTPGGPLFNSMRVDSLSYDRKSMPRCKCFPVTAPTWGQPHTCFTDFPAPDVSLTRKRLLRQIGVYRLVALFKRRSMGPLERKPSFLLTSIIR
ncbi:hypothetical protein GOBAR_AA31996 [Gossypium barbadense]|uniref:Uncharacterized protein n=1 Tax=Gossypium barbadense TaxID=3634 RepID=A0A2P5WC77_GOSBA|nr:hypothetical protein GOBAR_AA31996 [Gossypium barbadense]